MCSPRPDSDDHQANPGSAAPAAWCDGRVELREMRAFIAVVEEGGLSAAARRMHVSQPALSQTISALERRLGMQLLVRTTPGSTRSARPRR
jgi:molybdenum-dependent DNA-binding transcriptional regulator ModE